jgi:pilus assembly protein Flp/PilA
LPADLAFSISALLVHATILTPAGRSVPGETQRASHKGEIEMLELIRNWTKTDEDGASAVEYGLLVAGIAALIVLIVFAFGGVIQNVFQSTCNKVASGASTTGC